MSSEKLDAVTKMVGMVAELQAENAALREELLRQWKVAHDYDCVEHCMMYPTKEALLSGEQLISCRWPKPKILEQPK